MAEPPWLRHVHTARARTCGLEPGTCCLVPAAHYCPGRGEQCVQTGGIPGEWKISILELVNYCEIIFIG